MRVEVVVALLVDDVDALVAPSEGNFLAGDVGVVVERPVVTNGRVELKEVLQPGVVTAQDDIGRDVVPSLADALGYSCDGLLGR